VTAGGSPNPVPEGQDRLIDPDCRDGKHERSGGIGCVGYPCECDCHHGADA